MPDEYISREAMLEHLDRCKQSEDATTLTDAVITALQCFVQSQPTPTLCLWCGARTVFSESKAGVFPAGHWSSRTIFAVGARPNERAEI